MTSIHTLDTKETKELTREDVIRILEEHGYDSSVISEGLLMNIIKAPIKFFSFLKSGFDNVHDVATKGHTIFKIVNDFKSMFSKSGRGIAPHEFAARTRDNCSEVMASPTAPVAQRLECVNAMKDMQCQQRMGSHFNIPALADDSWTPNDDTRALLNAARGIKDKLASSHQIAPDVFGDDAALARELATKGVIVHGKYMPWKDAAC